MILVDTNLWLYAALQDIPQHSAAKAWLEATFNHRESIALPWSVALAVLRISTQRRLMQQPLSSTQAIELVEGWLEHPAAADPRGRHRWQSHHGRPSGRPGD